MNRERLDILSEYINAGKYPILIDEIPENVIEKGAIVINSDCSSQEFNGHYENFEFKKPKWYLDLLESAKKHTPVLIIKDINKVLPEEQRKFIELFKYKKVYTNKLPENCIIFVTYEKEKPIDKDIYSFLVQI